MYNSKEFPGDFTYIKADMKSQIDFALIDRIGRKLIQEFNIIQENWHLTDHKPIELQLSLNLNIDSSTLYLRAVDLNFDITNIKQNIARFNKLYDYGKTESYLIANRESIDKSIANYLSVTDVENAIIILDNLLQETHRIPGSRLKLKK